jgi:hypothetical protein
MLVAAVSDGPDGQCRSAGGCPGWSRGCAGHECVSRAAGRYGRALGQMGRRGQGQVGGQVVGVVGGCGREETKV